MDGGAWWAAVHGVAKSRTRLSDFPFTFPFHALEKEMATHTSVLAWRIPGTGEPDGLPSMGSHRVGYDWSDLAVAAAVSMEMEISSCNLCIDLTFIVLLTSFGMYWCLSLVLFIYKILLKCSWVTVLWKVLEMRRFLGFKERTIWWFIN